MSEDEDLKIKNPLALAPRSDAATVAVSSAREVAEVQAGMLIAQRFPRNEVQAADRILNACTRPTLAESALYEYARGGSAITGPSIRLAEVIAQQWGHIHTGVRELSQANGESTVEAFAWDVQTGARDSRVFQVRHWRSTKQGGYKIEDPRDVYELIANVGARRKRACILSIIPGDVVEAAVQQCEKTQKIKAEVTEERLKEVAEVFAELGVSIAAIEKRIQRRFDTMTPGQLLQLRKIVNSIRDGMSSPADWFELGEPGAVLETRTAVERVKDAAKKAAAKPPKEERPKPLEDDRDLSPARAGSAAPMPEGDSLEDPPPAGQTPPEQPRKSGSMLENIKTQIDRAAKLKDVELFNVAVDLIRGMPDADDRTKASDHAKKVRGALQ
jgi:hypothetical protein